MSFMRPEAQATLWRWREALAGASGVAVGIWWMFSGATLTRGIGGVLALASLALLVAGIQRGRFRGRHGGPGVVRVDEGQIAYFGPLTGGVVALSEIAELSYDPSGRPAHWIFAQDGEPDLHIPETAEGADALFDVFASLPGLRVDAVLRAQKQARGSRIVVWTRPVPRAEIMH